MSDFSKELEAIAKAFKDAEIKGKIELGRVGAEFLNSTENKENFSFLVFGGGTPGFNDGDPCTFFLHGVNGVCVLGENGDLPESEKEILDAIDNIYSPDEGDSLSSSNEFSKLVYQLNRLGLLNHMFDAAGFIGIVTKNGSLIEKEYEMGY